MDHLLQLMSGNHSADRLTDDRKSTLHGVIIFLVYLESTIIGLNVHALSSWERSILKQT